MMSFCPKCRTFYDDADLKFCLTDGVPLVNIEENGDLWNEAEEAIRQTKNQIRRETRRTQIKKIVSVLITTILTILIISVITINGWLFFNPAEEETVQNDFPRPTVEPTTKPVPTIIETFSPTPTITETPTETPIPTATPTATIFPTPTPLKTPPPTPTQTPSPTPTTEVCSQEEKARAVSYIRNKYGGRWREEILSRKERAQSEIARANQMSFQEITVELIFTPEMIAVSPANDCRRASVRVQYSWRARTLATGVELGRTPRRRPVSVHHQCRKDGTNWNCD